MSDPKDEIVEHIGPMRAFAINLCRNNATADDIVQDALIKAWTNIEKFQPGTNMRAWLFTIVRNTYFSLHRKRKREVEDVDGTYADTLSQRPDHDGKLALRDFAVAFDQLTDEQREALVLVGAQGFSYEEAAETAGVKIGTIKSRVNRGRAHLAELMDVGPDEDFNISDAVNLGVVAGQSAA